MLMLVCVCACMYCICVNIIFIFLLTNTESRKKDVVQIRKKHPDKIPVSVVHRVCVFNINSILYSGFFEGGNFHEIRENFIFRMFTKNIYH